MKIINSNCAGIDVGSLSHFVVIDKVTKKYVEFDVYAIDLKAINENNECILVNENQAKYKYCNTELIKFCILQFEK